MRKIALVLWSLVFVAAGVAGYLWLDRHNQTSNTSLSQVGQLGGPFDLITDEGETITYDDLKGNQHLVFFGFTHCPEICPSTLLDVTNWLNKLGSDADNLNAYFFTVDPERDTQEVLNDYVNAFHPKIVGVTGSPENMKLAISAYKVYAQRVNLDGGDYTMDHSAFVMLFREDGGFAGTISYAEQEETALAKLRRLVES